MKVVIVTGTSTGVGKTITTAALAALGRQHGLEVAVVKPVQTGDSDDEPSDIATIATLSGCRRTVQLVSLPDPLAPDTAARLREIAIPGVGELAHQTVAAWPDADVVLVEGAGGVLVRLDTAGGTLIDLAAVLAADGHDVRVVVVTSLTLGTLNHTELTVRALQAAGLHVSGLVVGLLPANRQLAERLNLDELPRVTGLPVLGAIPEHSGQLPPDEFQKNCATWLPAANLAIDAVR
jgi:dethiobiotin synthetase